MKDWSHWRVEGLTGKLIRLSRSVVLAVELDKEDVVILEEAALELLLPEALLEEVEAGDRVDGLTIVEADVL